MVYDRRIPADTQVFTVQKRITTRSYGVCLGAAMVVLVSLAFAGCLDDSTEGAPAEEPLPDPIYPVDICGGTAPTFTAASAPESDVDCADGW